MKKDKIICLVIIIAVCLVSLFSVFGKSFSNDLISWGHKLGTTAKGFFNKSYEAKDEEEVAYINDIPVNKTEILDRLEKSKALDNIMKSMGNNSSPWSSNPVDYVFYEKFDLYYAKTHNIKVLAEELDEYIKIQKEGWESPELKGVLEQYLKGMRITEEQFYSDIAPKSYEKTILKNKVKSHILNSANLSKASSEEKQKYLENYYKKNIKIEVKNTSFINQYNK